MLKIYGRANSINVRKVLWLCEEMELDYVREDWGRGFRATDTPDYLRLNPTGLIPTLEDGRFALRESNVIVRYLAAKHGRGDLLPEDPADRARVEQWMDWQASEVAIPPRTLLQGGLMDVAPFNKPDRLHEAARLWARQMCVVDDRVAATGSYIAGDDFTVADIPIGLVVHRWYALEVEKYVERPDAPAMAAYYERLSRRPPVLAHGRNGMP